MEEGGENVEEDECFGEKHKLLIPFLGIFDSLENFFKKSYEILEGGLNLLLLEMC